MTVHTIAIGKGVYKILVRCDKKGVLSDMFKDYCSLHQNHNRYCKCPYEWFNGSTGTFDMNGMRIKDGVTVMLYGEDGDETVFKNGGGVKDGII